MQTEALSGGFADAPREAARAFRAVLSAMARPGLTQRIAGAAAPAPASPAAAAVLLTLCDPGTPVHLAGAHDSAALRDWLAFHTGAPVVPAAAAMFALGTWEALSPLETYAIGTPEYPDRSATLIVERPLLEATGARLTGPGIRTEALLNLPEPAAFARNHALFPLGLDFIFTSGAEVAALPRSTQVEG